jgi:DNA-binding NarL/FixJ family response regulator
MPTAPPISLAIADDHHIFRKGLLAALSPCPDIVPLAEAGNGSELLDALRGCQPDVVLMDIKMPVLDGIETTRSIRRQYPRVRVLALSMHEDDAYVESMIRAGAQGYLLKTAHPEQVRQAVRTVFGAGYYFNEQLSVERLRRLLEPGAAVPPAVTGLVEKEVQVLRLICQQKTSAEIGDRLCMSARTVEGYRERLYDKTGAKNTAGLVVYALRHRIADLEEL